MRQAIGGTAVMIALLLAPAAPAQQEAEVVQRLERQLREIDEAYRLAIPPDMPIAERLLLDYGGTLRFGFYAIDAVDGETRILRQTDGRLYLRAELDGAHRFYGRLRFQYNDWNTGDSFDFRGDEWADPLGDRYWYEFDLRGAEQARTGRRLPWNLNVKAGKQYVQWGSGLTLSNVLYAGLLDAEWRDFGLIALAGLTPSGDTVDFDGSRPGFDSDTDRAFLGASIEYRGFSSHRPYLFILDQRDHNERDFFEFDSLIDTYPTRFKYDSTYVGGGSRGSLLSNLQYHVEAVYEFGEALSNSFSPTTGLAVEQTLEDIEAWAVIAGLTYLFRDAADSRLDAEFIAASGDDDRIDSADTFGGNTPGTTDESFVSLGYVNTGLALSPEVGNLISLRLGVSTSPLAGGARAGDWLRGLRIGLDGFLFGKVDDHAPINIRTGNESFIGGEIDLFADWRVTSDVFLNLRYGLFLPGDAMPDGEDDPLHFLYTGVTYAF